jgi:hypothetical protein
MSYLKKCLLGVIFLLIALNLRSPCFAQKFSLGNPSNEKILFKPVEQYMEIKLTDMNLPDVEEPPWYKKIFLHRKDFGLGYIEVKLGTKEDTKSIKTMAFSYEKESENRYKYKSLGISPDTPTSLSGQFPFPLQDQVQIRIVVKNFENEENIGLVKRVLDMVKGSGLEGLQAYSQVFTIASVTFGVIENLFPPAFKDDEILIAVSAEDITHRYHSVMFRSDNNEEFELFKLAFFPQPSLLPGLSFAEALKSDRIKRADFWEEAIVNATKILENNGLMPLLTILRSFAKELRHADLTYKDKVLFLAQAIHSWASKAVDGFPYANEIRMFTASNFRSIQLSAGDRKWLKGTPWDFPGGDCNKPPCKAVADFIAKSVVRDERALKYIRMGFQLIIDDEPIFIEKDKYFERFMFIHDSEFKMQFVGQSIVFKFKQGDLPLKYNNQFYKNKSIDLFVNKDDRSYYISSIRVF